MLGCRIRVYIVLLLSLVGLLPEHPWVSVRVRVRIRVRVRV